MKKISSLSRILSVLITLFLFTSPSFAQNCPPLLEFKVIVFVQTPYVKIVPQGRLWIFRQSQRNADGSVTVPTNLKALDSTGQVISSLNTKNDIFFSDDSAQPDAYKPPNQPSSTPAHAPFRNGIATIELKVFPYNGDARGDNINRLLLKYAAPFSRLSPASAGLRPQASVLSQPFKVLPETYTGITDTAVSSKSPSVGAKSVGFFAQIKSWFTWENVSSTAGQVAQFGLGMIPVLGGAIDCGKGYVNFFTGAEVDLVETELGCAGMTLDAVMTAAAIVNCVINCPVYATNKAIMTALKSVNRISKAVDGWMSKAIKGLLEKFLSRGIGYATEFIERIGNLKFLKELDETGERVLLEKADDGIGGLVKACALGLSRSRVMPQAVEDECDPIEAANIFSKVANRLKTEGVILDNTVSQQEFLDTVNEVSGIPGLRRTDPTNPKGGGPLNKIELGNVSEEGFRGTYGEMQHAALLKRSGNASDLDFKGKVSSSRGESDIDVYWKDTSGNSYFDDVKESVGTNIGAGKRDQARRLCTAAKANGSIGRWVISGTPIDLDSIEKIEKLGIAVVNLSGSRIDSSRITAAELSVFAQRCP